LSQIFLTQLAIKRPFSFPPYPMLYASALPRESRLSKICIKINRKPEKKHPQHYQSYLEQRLADFNNNWQKYLRHNCLWNKCLSFYLTQRLRLHYLGKADET